MRSLFIPLAVIGAAIPSAAGAIATPAQQQEIDCVHDTLSDDQRTELSFGIFGLEEDRAAAKAKVGPAVDAAAAACAARYGWGDRRKEAGKDSMVAKIAYDVMSLNIPVDLADELNLFMAGYDAEVVHQFTYEGQAKIEDIDGWRTGIANDLEEFGIGEPDHASSIAYLTAFANLGMTEAEWNEFFAKGIK